ncbi:hypothetical protein NVI2019_PEGOAJLN_00703 [Providencia alcalifaciens]|nr:hypothetical protein NVI2019_PEGOAJLN_00703 [Providencia alcalifaciens]
MRKVILMKRLYLRIGIDKGLFTRREKMILGCMYDSILSIELTLVRLSVYSLRNISYWLDD